MNRAQQSDNTTNPSFITLYSQVVDTPARDITVMVEAAAQHYHIKNNTNLDIKNPLLLFFVHSY